MKAKMILKKIAVLIGFLTALVCFSDLAYAAVLDDTGEEGTSDNIIEEGIAPKSPTFLPRTEPKEQQPKYVPGEILVKFKEGIDPESVLESVRLRARSIERVHSIKPVVARFRKDYKLEQDSNGWYPFLGKNYKESGDIPNEEIFKAAYQKMAPEERALYRSYKITLPEGITVEEAIARIKKNPYVEDAQPNRIVKVETFPQELPNDTYVNPSGDGITWSVNSWGQRYEDMWGLKKIQANEAWPLSQGEGIVVAVIDTGVDLYHPDLKNNIWANSDELNGEAGVDDDTNGYIDDIYGYNFAYDDNGPYDFYGHGTHVAGTIAAEGNNSNGVIGVAPKAKIMVLKGLDNYGSGPSSILANAIAYAAQNGAHILNCSWGGTGEDFVLADAFGYAHSKGCVSVVAAGNSNVDVAGYYPARFPTVIAVAASTQNDEKCSFSNYGSLIEVAAPGGGYENELGTGRDDIYNILSTMPMWSVIGANKPNLKISEGYGRLAGTSMACPHVSGVAALILSKNPDVTNEGVRAMLRMSADDIGEPGKDDYFGYGRVNAQRACMVSPVYVQINSPKNKSYVRGNIAIYGMAYLEEGFVGYELYYAPKAEPQNTVLITASNVPVRNGDLTLTEHTWNTTLCLDGEYILTLKVKYNTDKELKYSVEVFVDNINEPPAAKDFINKIAVVGRLLEFPVNVYDPDDPETAAGRLTCSATNLPPGAKFDAENRIFSWQPSSPANRKYEVTFTICDNEHTVDKTVTLTTAYVKESQLTTNPLGQSYPDIYGDKIVWEDYQYAETYVNGNYEVCLYDLVTGVESRITHDLSSDGNAKIYDNIIVWMSMKKDATGIVVYMYDISTGEKTQITPDGKKRLIPDIYKNKIVYFDWHEIYMYDLCTGQEIQITSDSYDQWNPIIYEDKIVWLDWREGWSNSDLYLYDLSSDIATQLTPFPNHQQSPSMYGNKVVWTDWQKGPKNVQVYMYDLVTQEYTQITHESVSQAFGRIYDDRVTWKDFRNGNWDIYLYDINKDAEIQITDNAAEQKMPEIYGDKIVYVDERNGNDDIYLAKVFLWPEIISIDPAAAALNFLITITGNDFGYEQGNSYVMFSSGIRAIIESWSDSEIKCRLPQGASSGPVNVVTLGGQSNGVDITVSPDLIAVPSDLNAQVLSLNHIRLIWQDNSFNEDGFIVERKISGKDFVEIGATGAGITIFDDLSVASDETYEYRVKAYNQLARSDYSNIVTASTIQMIPLSPSGLEVAAISVTQIDLKWQDNSYNEAGFKIERSLIPYRDFRPVGTVGANVTTYSDTDVAPNSRYHYRICAFNQNGDSGYSNNIAALTLPVLPLAPSDLYATSTAHNLVKLFWRDNSDNEDGFKIDRKVANGEFVEIASLEANSVAYEDRNVTPETKYYYRARAFDSRGSSISNMAYVATPAIPPAAPSNLTAANMSLGRVNLHWQDNSDDELSFRVGRKAAGDTLNYRVLALLPANTTSFTDTGVIPGMTYYYIVQARNIKAFSDFSNAAEISTPPFGCPVLDNIGDKVVKEGFILEFTVSAKDTDWDILSYSVTNLPGGASFNPETRIFAWTPTHEQVGIYNTTFSVSDGTESDSETITITVLAVPPKAPIITGPAGVTQTQARFGWWDASDNEDGFKVERSSDGVNFSIIDTLQAINAPYKQIYINRNVTSGATYYYRMCAHNTAGNSPYSNVLGIKIPPPPPPPLPAPSNLTARAISSSQINLSWRNNAGSGVTFNIWYSLDSVTFTFTGSTYTTSFAAKDLTPNTRYYYKVNAYSHSGGVYRKSDYSNIADATTLPRPAGAPSNLSAVAISKSDIRLTWQDNSDNEDGFKIERSASSWGNFQQIATVGKDITTYTNGGLPPKTTYYYRIRAYNNSGWNSDYSNKANARTPQDKPSAPTDLIVTSFSTNHVTLEWKDNTGGTAGYGIYRANDERLLFMTAGVSLFRTITTWTDTSRRLLPGNTYHYRVRALGRTGQSDYSNVVEVTIPR